MKSYTDIEQSKKLAEILPIESADMFYRDSDSNDVKLMWEHVAPKVTTPCWSLAALLDVLPKEVEIDGQRYAPCLFPVQSKWLLKLWYNSNYTITSPIGTFSDNPVDACVEMILKLREQKLL